MKYKVKLEERFQEKKFILEELGFTNINYWNETILDNSYTKEEEIFIINSKKDGMSTKQIAQLLNRPYYGVVDKLRRMKKINENQ